MKKSNATGVSKNTQTFDLDKSETMFPPDKFLTSIENIASRAIAQGLLPTNYDVRSRYIGRMPVDLDLIITQAEKDKQPKGNSAEDQRVVQLVESLETEYRYELGNIICSTHSGTVTFDAHSGDHRLAAASKSKKYDSLLADVFKFIPSDKDDAMMGLLIASNSNNHAPQWPMTKDELIAFLYRTITSEGNEKLLEMFDSTSLQYNKKTCKGFIKSFKHPISDNQLKSVLNGIHVKLEEESIFEGMFKCFKSPRAKQISDDFLQITGDYTEVEKSVIGRRLPMLITECHRDDKSIDVILHLTTSDFALSEEKLNDDRFKIFSPGNHDQVYAIINDWINLNVSKKDIYKVRFIGYRPQHSSEDPTKLIRIIPNVNGKYESKDKKARFDVSYVTYQEAIKLPSMVIVT